MKTKKTFWDFCAPLYDMAEQRNKKAYNTMLKIVRDTVPHGSSVLEIAGGTGSISLTVSDKSNSIICSDISEKMLAVARKKALKRGTGNITFENINVFDTGFADDSFDVLIAAQVLHLLDSPEKAAAELRRTTKNLLIMPISLTKDLKGYAKFMVNIFRLFGFSPRAEFDQNGYRDFLCEIGFKNFEIIPANGKIPMAIAIWKKSSSDVREEL